MAKQSQRAFFKKYQAEIEEAEREEKPQPESRSPERADDASSSDSPQRMRPTTLARPSNLASVPTSLEKIFSGTSDERNVHEVLGVLVEAHIKEAESIIGRRSEERRVGKECRSWRWPYR